MKRAKSTRSRQDAPRDAAAWRRYREEYDLLKRRLRALGYVCIGSLIRRRRACGKASCACSRDASKRHGPYYQWSWKISGRTQSRMLTAPLARLYRQGIRNHRRLDQIIDEMRTLSLRAFQAAAGRGEP